MSNNDGDGIFSAYDNRLDAFELYHLIQEGTGAKKNYGGPALPALGHALAGGVASALSKAIVYPIDIVVTRMQVQRGLKRGKGTEHSASDTDAQYRNPVDAAKRIYMNEGGINAFYAGLSTDVVKHIADSFIFFFAYQTVRERMLRRKGGKQLPVLQELSVGVIAGALSKAVTSPIQNIITRQQTSGQYQKQRVKDIALQIKNEKGITGFWTGYSASLILTLNPSITFAVDNALRNFIPKNLRENPPPLLTFLVAALSKVIATTITYPVMLAKSRQQASHGSSAGSNSENSDPKAESNSEASRLRLRQAVHQLSKLVEGQAALLRALHQIYRHEGIAGLYAGLEGEWVKGFLQHGLTMTVKESVHGSIIQLYFVLLKLTRRWPADLEQVKQNAQVIVQDAQQRAENIGTSVAEQVKRSASPIMRDAQERAENIGTSIAEQIKDSTGPAVRDAQQRAENVGITIVEQVKESAGPMARDVQQRAENIRTSVAEQAKTTAGPIVRDAQQRAENIGVSVAEGTRDISKKVGGEEK